jgi:hypothetical protein
VRNVIAGRWCMSRCVRGVVITCWNTLYKNAQRRHTIQRCWTDFLQNYSLPKFSYHAFEWTCFYNDLILRLITSRAICWHQFLLWVLIKRSLRWDATSASVRFPLFVPLRRATYPFVYWTMWVLHNQRVVTADWQNAYASFMWHSFQVKLQEFDQISTSFTGSN